MESEFAYFKRRASEERQWGLAGLTRAARQAHLTMAEHLESMARAIRAEECRQRFRIVASNDAPSDEVADRRAGSTTCP